MPPSPSLRRSPAREPQTDSHRRGRSLESGLSFKEKDDDLALFNEMQSKERECFLLQSTDDFEDILSSKSKPFSDFKLGINIPVRGESSDLLYAEGDKNDYDWLLTPPDTPLFPSLDDDATPANLVHSGRPRSRPISISRSSTMEKGYRSNRGSPSPQRLSPSPRSGNSVFQSQGRPSSAPHSSPSLTVRSRTPSRRPSPPPIKPSTPQPSSSTSAYRQTNTGSGAPVSCSLRGTSPARTSRGNSASPKIKAWQSNIPGFSLDAPPNLRTSLDDRPASYVRGSSPASRNSRDSSSKFSRQSLSPTTSRSISSSHSHERDRFSSHSKGSVASSGDDDADSLHSISTSVTDHSLARRSGGGLPRNRPLAFSKKPNKTFSLSSAPKRSFDSAIRQMDRKSPQNMFRPLLSSVPSSTFYSAKPSSDHHAMVSRNSSLTTSSNTSSDHGNSAIRDTEGSEQNQDDMTCEGQRTTFPDIHDEVFAFDKMKVTSEDAEHEIHNRLPDLQPVSSACGSIPGNSEDGTALAMTAMSDALDVDDYMKVDCPQNTYICSRCGCRYLLIDMVDCEVNMCLDCKQKDSLFLVPPETRTDDALLLTLPVVKSTKKQGPSSAIEPLTVAPELLEIMEMGGSSSMQCPLDDNNASESQTLHVESKGVCILDNSLPSSAGEGNTLSQASHPTVSDPSAAVSEVNSLHKFHDYSKPNGDVVEGAGISILLKRSSSCKGPLIEGRNVTAATISFNEPYYARTLTSSISMRSSIGHGSISTSSSNDFSFRRAEMLVQRQLSNKRSDNSSKPQSTVTSFSGTSAQASQDLCLATGSQDENFEVSGSTGGNILGDETPATSSESVVTLANMKLHEGQTSLSGTSVSKEDTCHGDTSSSTNDNSSLELYNNVVCDQLEDRCMAYSTVDADHVFHGNDADSQKNGKCVVDKEESVVIPDSTFVEKNAIPDKNVDEMVATEDSHLGLPLIISETEDMGHHPGPSAAEKEADCDSRDELKESSGLPMSDEDVKDSALQAINSVNKHGIVEESTVMLEGQRGRRGRSLTLEEATDTILLCSSIVHNLAYEAASIAIEKENENLLCPLEGSNPTVTIVGKTTSDRRELRGRRNSKRTPKSQKGRQQRHVETDTNPPSSNAAEADDAPDGKPVTRNVGIPDKTDGTKPPKLESKCNCTIM